MAKQQNNTGKTSAPKPAVAKPVAETAKVATSSASAVQDGQATSAGSETAASGNPTADEATATTTQAPGTQDGHATSAGTDTTVSTTADGNAANESTDVIGDVGNTDSNAQGDALNAGQGAAVVVDSGALETAAVDDRDLSWLEQPSVAAYPILSPFKHQGVVRKPPGFLVLTELEAEDGQAAGVLGEALPVPKPDAE